MDIDTLLEEIRTRLREAQEDTCTNPWLYQNEDLIKAIRSAIRHISVLGVPIPSDLDLSGTFTVDPTEVQGMLIALKVSADLLKGDLANKLNSGELGISVRSVVDSFSTTEASKGMQGIAKAYLRDFDTLLTIVIVNSTDVASAVFGQQGTSFDSA